MCVLVQDYLIAEGHNQATARGQVASFESKYYFSQDGIRCVHKLGSSDAALDPRVLLPPSSCNYLLGPLVLQCSRSSITRCPAQLQAHLAVSCSRSAGLASKGFSNSFYNQQMRHPP